jgi:protein arginine kinase
MQLDGIEGVQFSVWAPHARRVSGEETQGLLSPIRMGIHLDRFDRFGIGVLNELFLFSQPAHLQRLHGSAVEGEERAIVRANFLRERLASV